MDPSQLSWGGQGDREPDDHPACVHLACPGFPEHGLLATVWIMRTRADAGGPDVLGRVRTIWRAALGGLWLAVRALAARAGLTLALIALTAFAVGVAAAGAMYLRAAGESLLQDRLAATSPFGAGLLVERRVATSTEVARLQQLLRHDPGLAVPALKPPLFGLESDGFLTYTRPGDGDGPRARLAARAEHC
jgi:hypothetical protein